MREIKFRAWDKKEKKMLALVESYLISGRELKAQGCILMQFTGLKDKNGKEIYEGDIIKWCNECIFVVKWSDSDCGFYYDIIKNIIENTIFDIRLYRSDESALIIGNIYANPELLKEHINGKCER